MVQLGAIFARENNPHPNPPPLGGGSFERSTRAGEVLEDQGSSRMSGAESESRGGAAGYEQVLKKADQSVASFEEDAETPLRRLQHFLHAHPTAIPAIVLV